MKTNRDTIVAILGAVLPGLAKKDQLPQGQCFVFIDGEVITFNDRVAIHHPLPEEFSSIQGAVKATELYSILSKMPEGVLVDVSTTEAEMVLATASIQARIRMEADIVNRYASVAIPKKMIKVTEGMLEAVNRVSFSASTDLSKPFLTHVYVEGNRAIACDNHRVMICTFKGNVEPLFIPATLIDNLLSYDPVEFVVAEGCSHWRNASGVLFSFRTVEGKYPDVEPFFNDYESWPEVVFPKELAEVVDRVGQALDKETVHPGVDVAFKGNRVVVSGTGPFASMKEKLPLTNKIEIAFSIAADFFLDCLRLGVKAHVSSNRMCLVNSDKSIRHLICLKAPDTSSKEKAAEA